MPQTETGQLSHPGEAGAIFGPSGHEYGRWPEEGHDAITGMSRGASAMHLYCLDAQHRRWWCLRRAVNGVAGSDRGGDQRLLHAVQLVEFAL